MEDIMDILFIVFAAVCVLFMTVGVFNIAYMTYADTNQTLILKNERN